MNSKTRHNYKFNYVKLKTKVCKITKNDFNSLKVHIKKCIRISNSILYWYVV